jgi:glycosyltransferase involved in cell wall biosynthesis
MGDCPTLERDGNTWKHGTICYVGRLERRKGVIEWIDAAVSVAHEYPNIYFEFIGANVLWNEYMRGEEFVKRRIPDEFKTRFFFRGQQKRSSLPQFLSRARIAVVPSRWDNFPNTCVEAMCSGIPVIVSPSGGMVEMIEDNRTGWIAANASSDGLAETLRRALETPSTKIAEMGHDASLYIRQMCDNKKILESHLDFRGRVVNKGAKHSLHLPVNLLWDKRSLSDGLARQISQNKTNEGIAIVITCFNTGQFLDKCLLSLGQQTKEPAAVVIVDYGSTERQTLKALIKAQHEGWQVIREIKRGLVPAKNTGTKAILDSGINPIGFAFLSVKNFLQPRFVAVCESVLQRCTEVGLVSCWVSYSKSNANIWIKPCPVFPYQWLSNDVAPFGVIRTEALLEAGNFRSVMNQGYEDWYLFNAIMAVGWVAVTVPEILVVCRGRNDSLQYITSTHAYSQMRRELMERFPDMITRDAKDIALLTMTNFACLQNNKSVSLRNLLAMAQKIVRHLKIKFPVLRMFKCLILFLV